MLHMHLYADRLTHPVELSSSKMPPKMMPSLMPASWKPSLVISPPAGVSVGFLSTPKWNWPWPLTSFLSAWVWALRGEAPVEKKTWEVLDFRSLA